MYFQFLISLCCHHCHHDSWLIIVYLCTHVFLIIWPQWREEYKLCLDMISLQPNLHIFIFVLSHFYLVVFIITSYRRTRSMQLLLKLTEFRQATFRRSQLHNLRGSFMFPEKLEVHNFFLFISSIMKLREA
jgi:hypothetical protein